MSDDLKIGVSTKEANAKIDSLKRNISSISNVSKKIKEIICKITLDKKSVDKTQKKIEKITKPVRVIKARIDIDTDRHKKRLKELESIDSDYAKRRDRVLNTNRVLPQEYQRNHEADFNAWKTVEERKELIRKRNEKRSQKQMANQMSTLARIVEQEQTANRVKNERSTSDWSKETKKRFAPKKKMASTRGPAVVGGGDIINQLPQNPLLGRFAQFGMMASGMAATLFLFQMLSAQLVNIMEILKTWEESILKLVDSFDLTAKATKDLPVIISKYSRDLGVSQSGMAEAVGATMKYGMSSDQGNANKMYAMNYSDNVKDYKEAALILSMAGTEFGDKAAQSYMKKWKAYSGEGEGETSGSFGYEWEKLKTSAKDNIFQIWETHGKNVTDNMRKLSDWLSANRETVSNYFQTFINGLVTFGKVLKALMPGLKTFALIFVVSNSAKMFAWFLTSITGTLLSIKTAAVGASVGISNMFRGITTGAMTSQVAVTRLSIAVKGLKASMMTFLPALAAMAAIWAGFKIYDKIKEIREFNNLLTKSASLSPEKIEDMTSSKADSTKYELKGGVKSLEGQIEKLEKKKKQIDDMIKISGIKNSPLSRKKSQEFAKEIEEKTKQLEMFKQKIKQIENRKADQLGIVVPEGVASVEDLIGGLERVNKELGYMPDLLFKIKSNMDKIEFPGLKAAVGAGAASVITYKSKFDNLLQKNPKTKQSYELSANEQSLAAGGFNSADMEMLKFQAVRRLMKNDMDKMSGSKDSVEYKDLAEGLKEVEKVINNFNTGSATIELKKYQGALFQLQKTVTQLDMTDFEKKMDDIDRMRLDDPFKKQNLKNEERKILTHNIQDQMKTWRGEKPELDKKKRDVSSSSLNNNDQELWKKHLDYLGAVEKLEFKIGVEKQKGLEIASNQQINYERDLKNAHLLDQKNAGKFKNESDYDELVKYNKEYADFQKSLNVHKRDQIVGTQQSYGMESISDMEKRANIEIKMKETTFALTNESLKLNKAEQAAILTSTRKRVEKEEEIKQIQSQIDLYDFQLSALEGYYNKRGFMTEEHYKIMQTIIAKQYQQDLLKDTDKFHAEMLRKEREYQLKLKNRRKAPLSEDLKLGFEEVGKQLTDSYQTLGQIMETSLVSAFNGVSNAMNDFIWGIKGSKEAFKDMARSVLQDLTSMIIKQELFNMLVGSGYSKGSNMGGLVGGAMSLFGSFFSAKGNVVSGINAYSNKIVSSPTFVPGASRVTAYATGGALFGEKGPEAIMPLTRLPSGNLGVETTSNGSSNAPIVEINITNNGKPVQASQASPPKWDGEKMIIDVILDHTVNNKGNFRSSMKGLLSA